MCRRIYPLILLLILVPTITLGANSLTRPIYPLPPLLTGLEDLPPEVQVAPPPYHFDDVDGVDLIGDTMWVGSTWYEYQHNSQSGRQIVLDEDGYIHIVWTNGLDQLSTSRHVYYNYIDPEGNQGWPGTGYPVESSTRAGFTCLTVGWNGTAFPAFHQVLGSSPNPHSAVAVDFLPHTGIFMVHELPWYNNEDLPYIWPRITMKTDGEMLVTSVGNDPASGQTWSLGTYDQPNFTINYTPQILTPDIQWISNEVAAARVSNRVGGAWVAPAVEAGGYDIHAMVDDDGLNLNFDNDWNVTKFIPPDLSFLPDTLMADADTLRAWADVSLFFDMDNYIHLAFTTISWFELEGGLSYYNASLIWHWSERMPDEYHLIANAFNPENTVSCGNWAFRAQRPSLGQDPSTGYLYCMYQEFDVDTSAISAAGYPSGEVKISVSTDNGEAWSVGTNITNSVTPSNAGPGECTSEGWPSMAEIVDDYCHVFYIFDLDAGAGCITNPEGSVTLNPVVYHKVPVDLIPTSPTVENIPFHVEHAQQPLGLEQTQSVSPNTFDLHQNSPNPFNPETRIQFTLGSVSYVRLSVYNLKGEVIRTLAEGTYSTGTHSLLFDGSALASGMYIYRLEADGKCLQKKMLLIK